MTGPFWVTVLLAINTSFSKTQQTPYKYSSGFPYKAVEYKQCTLQRAGVGVR